MFARILLRFWPTTFKNPVCWGFCIHCGQPSAKAAASPRDILHRTKDRVMTCLIRVFMGFSFLESLGLWLLNLGEKEFEENSPNLSRQIIMARGSGASLRKPLNYSV